MSSNSIAVVTGSNTGVGFETVRALITDDQPYTVVLCSRDLKKGQAAAEKLKSEAKQGSEIVPLQLDIEDDASIEQFVKDVGAKFGRVDVLINNAGQ
jgi:NAD(P)-dependent dehydrogenase (short-subunit alcohol dehydrogenase family)